MFKAGPEARFGNPMGKLCSVDAQIRATRGNRIVQAHILDLNLLEIFWQYVLFELTLCKQGKKLEPLLQNVRLKQIL